MSRKLPVVTAKEVVRVVERMGFVFDRQKGSHAVYYRHRDKRRVIIPVHIGKEIKPRTLSGIIKDMGLTVEEFRKLL
ncbi:MAG: type II toxin-antitoxin system HicA family toxin [Bacillota bacterium]|nr:type II toxin-antitoxin system HicA family toxin [Thermoanaerobacteraceae bacterium]